MLLKRLRDKFNYFDRKLDDSQNGIDQLLHGQNQLSELCSSIDKKLADIEERLIHVEDRCKIVDEDKIEDMRTRLIHIEDKNTRLLEAEILKYKKMESDNARLYEEPEGFQYDYGIFGMWFTQNYGAALTSYALYKEVEQFGYSAVLIDLPQIGGGEDSTTYFVNALDRTFINQNTLTTETLDLKNIRILNSVCDSFIFGSDSLWGGGYEYQLYFLEGVLFGSKICNEKNRISFSTSFGSWQGTKCNSVEQQYVKMLLKRFHYISVREKAGALLCKTEFGIEASWTLDPVWLLPVEEYDKVMDTDTDLPDEFIFAYMLQPLADKIDMIKYLSEKLDKKVVFVSDMNVANRKKFGEYKRYDFIYYDDMSVPAWLTAVKTAAYVITDSYHGMCFSMIFKKQFITLYPRDGIIRFRDLQNLLNISDRINIKDTIGVEKALSEPIDYVKLDNMMQKKIEQDRNELKYALQKKTDKNDNIFSAELENAVFARKLLRKLN